MAMVDRTTIAAVAAAGIIGLTACNDEASTDNNYAEALSHVVETRDQAAAKVHAEERMKALRDKAEAEAVAAHEKAWQELIVVPAELPADLDTACNELSSAFDAFQLARLSGTDLERYEAVKQRDLEKLVERCQETGNLELAACQGHALANAPTSFDADDATNILTECEEKVSGEAPKTAKAEDGAPAGAGAP
jgi:hypothetical protein